MIRGQKRPLKRGRRRPRRSGNFALWHLAVVSALGCAAAGCKDAPNPTGPARVGPDTAPPSLSISPSKDTLVDSIGVLAIAVAAHDQSLVDSIVLRAQGVPSTFQAAYPRDTTALVFWTVALATLHHQAFTFQVLAGDAAGHDTITPSIKVTPR